MAQRGDRDAARAQDRALVARANRGDEKAFEAIYRLHRPFVRQLARRFLKSDGEAEEITQDVFLELFARFPGFALRHSFRAYFFPIVRNRCISAIRKRQKVVPLNEGHRIEWPSGPDDFEAWLADLSEGHREVLRLRFQLDFQLDEIAAALDIPVGTVKSRLSNALKKLRKKEF